VQLHLVGGGTVDLSAAAPGAAAKLLVLYRGAFCPFCKARALCAAETRRRRRTSLLRVAPPYLRLR
jgi:hypothetical protein